MKFDGGADVAQNNLFSSGILGVKCLRWRTLGCASSVPQAQLSCPH